MAPALTQPLALILTLLLASTPTRATEPLRVAVAANFKPLLEQLNRDFETNSGTRVLLSSASTGVLANQILYGAPYDVFLAADRERTGKVEQAGLAVADSRRCYARGKLVLAGAEKLNALENPELSLVIANPETAPYGLAAQQVLQRPAFQAGSDRKLVRGANVAQAYQFWYQGGIKLALLPAAIGPKDALAVPTDWHLDLIQEALILKSSRNASQAEAYLEWLGSDTVQNQIQQAGYDPCP